MKEIGYCFTKILGLDYLKIIFPFKKASINLIGIFTDEGFIKGRYLLRVIHTKIDIYWAGWSSPLSKIWSPQHERAEVSHLLEFWHLNENICMTEKLSFIGMTRELACPKPWSDTRYPL